jgi:hypothetical protein
VRVDFLPPVGIVHKFEIRVVSTKLNWLPLESDRCDDRRLVPVCFLHKISGDVRDPRQAVKVKVVLESRVYIPATREAVYLFRADPFSK